MGLPVGAFLGIALLLNPPAAEPEAIAFSVIAQGDTMTVKAKGFTATAGWVLYDEHDGRLTLVGDRSRPVIVIRKYPELPIQAARPAPNVESREQPLEIQAQRVFYWPKTGKIRLEGQALDKNLIDTIVPLKGSPASTPGRASEVG